MQLQTLFLQAILLIVVVHAVANPAPTGTVAGPVLPPAASPPTAGIPSLTSSSTAELSVGNVAFNTWDRTRAAQSDKYKKTNELEATTQKLREEVRSLTTERDQFIEGSMMYRAVHKLMIVGEYELAEVDAVSKAIDYNRLNRTLQEWRAANAVTAMNPAAETYMLKNLSELRSYAVIRLRVLKRIMSHICILTAQLGLNADTKALEPNPISIAYWVKDLGQVTENYQNFTAEVPVLEEMKSKILSLCDMVRVDLKDACLLTANREFESRPKDFRIIDQILKSWLANPVGLAAVPGG